MSFRARQPSRPSGLTLPGIPELAGAQRPEIPERATPPWQSPPAWWPPGSSVNEWACYYWLTIEPHHFREGLNFRRQVAVEALGLFSGRPFTRIDFLFPLHGAGAVASADGDYDYLAWDPITPFTHPIEDRELDEAKRQLLAENGHPNKTFLVWIDPIVLDWPDAVLPQALRGVDLSARAKGW